jgi:GTPase SAR1 family protein
MSLFKKTISSNNIKNDIFTEKTLEVPSGNYSSQEEFIKFLDDEKVETEAFNYHKAGMVLSYVVKKSVNKTVLVIGKSRSGKSQFIKNLVHPGVISKLGIIATTAEPKNYTLTIEYEGTIMTINFIDTPGFDEQRDKARSNQDLKDLITTELKRLTTHIDMIIVMTKGMSSDDVKGVAYCAGIFGNIGHQNTYLMKSHADGSTEEMELRMIEEFNRAPGTSALKESIGDKILFTGCVPEQSKKDSKNITEIQIKRNSKFLKILSTIIPFNLADILNAHVAQDENISNALSILAELVAESMRSFSLLNNEYGRLSRLVLSNGVKDGDYSLTEFDKLPESEKKIWTSSVDLLKRVEAIKMVVIEEAKLRQEAQQSKQRLKEVVSIKFDTIEQINNFKDLQTELELKCVDMSRLNDIVGQMRDDKPKTRNKGFRS